MIPTDAMPISTMRPTPIAIFAVTVKRMFISPAAPSYFGADTLWCAPGISMSGITT
jgi:hypothetical protein